MKHVNNFLDHTSSNHKYFSISDKLLLCIVLSSLFLSQQVLADFTIESGITETTEQTLTTGQTGVIKGGGVLNVSGDAISPTGARVTITNSGSIVAGDDGIDSDGDNVSITNSGNITAVDDAIYTTGDNDTIINNGSIVAGYYGVASSGDNGTITNSGSIAAEVSGISSGGDNNVTITNSGSITAKSYGISLRGDNNGTITNSGDIITTAGDGIRSEGSNSNIVNNGSVTAEDYGITSDGDNATIANSGSITANYDGIYSDGDNATITNSGSVSADDGIDSGGDNATITNSGTVAVEDDGIDSYGDNATIANSGSIAAQTGIDSSGDNGTINNSGGITAISRGIYSNGDNATITNSGTILGGKSGIYSIGDNNTLTNNGNITIGNLGLLKYGLYSSGDSNTITNSGNITSTSIDDFYGGGLGITSEGDNATITNSGIITATLSGIWSYGDNAVITNSGSITAQSGILGGANTTLNLLPGSQILGAIRLGGGVNDTVNIYGGSVSATLTFVGTENINLLGLGVKSDNVVVSVDGTAEAARSVTLSNITGAIHGQISQRTAQRAPLETAKDTSSTISPSLYFKQRKPTAWAQPFGGSFDRDAEGGAGALAYDHDFVGGNLGYEWDLEKARVGLFGGMVHSQTDSKIKSFSTDTEHFYIGGYGSRQLQGFSITTSLLAGYGTHDNERLVFDNLNGKQKAKSDFDSVFISPSLTIATAYKIYSHFELRPSVNLTYSIAWLDGYSESGTTLSNLKVDDREIQAFSSKLQGAAAYILNAHSEIELRVGVNSRNTFDGDTKFSALGGQSKFANIGDENVIGGFVGARLKVANSENLSLIADVQLGGNSNEDYLMGNLSLEYSFH